MNTTVIEENKTVNKTPKNEKMRRYYERVKADPEKHAKMKARQKLWRETKKQLKNLNESIEQ